MTKRRVILVERDKAIGDGDGRGEDEEKKFRELMWRATALSEF